MYFIKNTRNGVQLVIQAKSELRELLLQELYASRLSGHMGIRKTMSALSECVWWPGILRTVESFVNSCQVY